LATGQVWTGAENLAPTGIRSADRPVRTQSIYQLSYPAHTTDSTQIKNRTVGTVNQSHFQCTHVTPFPGLWRPKNEAHQSPKSNAEVKKQGYTRPHTFMARTGTQFFCSGGRSTQCSAHYVNSLLHHSSKRKRLLE
jgi:hypothetical protein